MASLVAMTTSRRKMSAGVCLPWWLTFMIRLSGLAAMVVVVVVVVGVGVWHGSMNALIYIHHT